MGQTAAFYLTNSDNKTSATTSFTYGTLSKIVAPTPETDTKKSTEAEILSGAETAEAEIKYRKAEIATAAEAEPTMKPAEISITEAETKPTAATTEQEEEAVLEPALDTLPTTAISKTTRNRRSSVSQTGITSEYVESLVLNGRGRELIGATSINPDTQDLLDTLPFIIVSSN